MPTVTQITFWNGSEAERLASTQVPSQVDFARTEKGLYFGDGVTAVSALRLALLNPFWRDATVRITGGTVTSVVVDGQTVATATNATVTVPTGKSITLTYSAAPTWTWNTL